MDCWFISFKNISYRTTYEHRILCFISFRDIMILQEVGGNQEITGLWVSLMSLMAMRVSMIIHATENHQLRNKTKTMGHAQCCVKWPSKVYSGYINRIRNISWKYLQYSKHSEMHYFCQHLVPKMISSEHKETWMTFWKPNYYDWSKWWFSWTA